MSLLPSGTVTFLFTDIEGSTRLLQQLGEKYATLISDHHRLLREACETRQGSVVGSEGDSMFVAFARAAEAVKAVVMAQRALSAHAWPEGVSLRVRMGLHTGEAEVTSSGYVGIDIHRAARIAAAAHGGQVLLSQTTYDLVESDLPPGVTTRDLGQHHLKDLRQPKQLYQLVIAGLAVDFPPLKSLAGTPTNLPPQPTSFIGRAQEVGQVARLLSAGRLVTLTGPGGTGKTRLALQVAAEMMEHFPGGVFFIALTSITDPELVAAAIAQTLGLSETTGRPILDSLKDYLRGKSALLVLDNFEQVIRAAPLVADLLAACSKVKFVATSREGLRLSGERLYPVPPLELPDLAHLPPLETLSQYAAVELFTERAQAVKPDFSLTHETAPAVAEICWRLDGLPLAIELAAARIRWLSPSALLARLDRRLDVLTGGARDLPARQQTLRLTIAWSYDLLDDNERALFRRLSIFVSGATAEAVEAVAGDHLDGGSMLSQLGSLLDKSLLQQEAGPLGEPRFVMLQVLREFGLEELGAHGELEPTGRRHADFFLALAEQAEASLESEAQASWLERMEQEHDNLRAALGWCQTAQGTPDVCLRLARTLGLFWERRGYFSEGRARLTALLGKEMARGRTAARAGLLARAAELAYRQSDYPATIALAGESLAIWREIGDQQGIAAALLKLGNAATEVGDHETAGVLLEEAQSTWRALEDKHGTARAFISLGWAALRSGDYGLANARLSEALALSRELGDARSIGFELAGLGEIALRQGETARAARLVEESLALRRQLGNKWGVGVSLGTLGWVAIWEGDWNRAVARLGESLEVRLEIGDRGGSAWCLERLAEVARAQGQAEKAVRLYGAASALRDSIDSVIDPVDRAEYENDRAALRAELGDEQFAEAWEAGRALALEQAVALALESAAPRGNPPGTLEEPRGP